MRDEQNRGRIFIRIAIALDREVAAVAHHVRVRHDAVAVDDKAGADAPLDCARIPGRPVIRLDLRRGDADQTFLNLAVRAWRDGRRLERLGLPPASV